MNSHYQHRWDAIATGSPMAEQMRSDLAIMDAEEDPYMKRVWLTGIRKPVRNQPTSRERCQTQQRNNWHCQCSSSPKNNEQPVTYQ